MYRFGCLSVICLFRIRVVWVMMLLWLVFCEVVLIWLLISMWLIYLVILNRCWYVCRFFVCCFFMFWCSCEISSWVVVRLLVVMIIRVVLFGNLNLCSLWWMWILFSEVLVWVLVVKIRFLFILMLM